MLSIHHARVSIPGWNGSGSDNAEQPSLEGIYEEAFWRYMILRYIYANASGKAVFNESRSYSVFLFDIFLTLSTPLRVRVLRR